MAHLAMPREGTVRTSGDNIWLFTDRISFKMNPGRAWFLFHAFDSWALLPLWG